MQAPTPADEFEYLPGWQVTHAVPLLYVPATHTAHDVDPTALLNCPTAHSAHDPMPAEPVNVPAGHGEHDVEPFVLN